MHQQESPLAPIDVLIAEDDALARQVVRFVLEREGYRCAEAENGLEAVDMARRHLPRCVLLDLVLPGLDGFAVARQLRADARTRGARIHCLTGRTDRAAWDEAHEAGCEEYLTKPLDALRLLEVVRGNVRAEPSDWVGGLTLTSARERMDWLENNGNGRLEASLDGGPAFAVRCVPSDRPAGD